MNLPILDALLQASEADICLAQDVDASYRDTKRNMSMRELTSNALHGTLD